jgi:acetolactate decarboxylase
MKRREDDVRATKCALAAILVLILLTMILSGCGSEAGVLPSLPSSTAVVVSAASGGASAVTSDDHEVLYQYSTLNALMAGVYDGGLTIGELAEHGDQGLGTTDKLDGEMVMLDGKAYRIGYDGSVLVLSTTTLTPFAEVTDFDADITLQEDGPLTFDQLKAAIDQARPSANLPYAIRIEGTFASMMTRSVPAQTKPYRPLAEVLKGQAEFQFTNVKGDVVGFWLPAYMDGPNAGGYHLHFITADRTGGGHVLDCRPANVTVGLDETAEWTAQLPTEGAFLSTELSQDQYR